MANFRFSPTIPGSQLMADVQNGAVLVPTKFVIGTGYMTSGKQPGDISNVITPLKEFPVSRKMRIADGFCVFGFVMSNEDITNDFYLREIALYAKAEYRDAGGNVTSTVPEICLIYGNSANTADLYPAYSTSTVVERTMEISSYIGGAAEVDLTIESGIYLSYGDLGAPNGVAPLGANGIVPLEHLPDLTPGGIGAVKKSGDYMTGDLDIRKNIPHLLMGPADTTRTDLFKNAAAGGSDFGTFLRDISGEKVITAILTAKDGKFYLHKDGVEYPVYSALRKPTPQELGVSALGHNHQGDTLRPSGIELNETGVHPDNGGYIDFHYGGSQADLTSRIVEFEEGKVSVSPMLFEGTNRVFTQGVLAGSSLNNVPDGVWAYNQNTANAPSEQPGIVFHKNWNENYSFQFVNEYATGNLLIRVKISGAWKAWRTVYDTGNRPTVSDLGLSASVLTGEVE